MRTRKMTITSLAVAMTVTLVAGEPEAADAAPGAASTVEQLKTEFRKLEFGMFIHTLTIQANLRFHHQGD